MQIFISKTDFVLQMNETLQWRNCFVLPEVESFA